MMEMNAREQKGITIAHLSGQVKRIEDSFYLINSQSGKDKYEVSFTEDGWICSYPDHLYRNVKCKHIWAIEISQKLKEQLRNSVVIEEVTV